MPEHLIINQFHGGWAPSDDAINGRKNVLLRMNNVELDKNGAIKLSGGCKVVQSGYPAEAHTLYSRILDLTRHDYAALTDGKVYRDGSEILTGGNAVNAAFGTAFDYVLICSGNLRKKDTGSGTPTNLGIEIPTIAPTFNTVTAATTGSLPLDSSTVNPIGTVAVTTLSDGTKYIGFEITSVPGSVVLQSFNAPNIPIDWATFSDGGTETDDDILLLNLRIHDIVGHNISAFLDILLESPNAGGDPVSNYYRVDLTAANLAVTGSLYTIRRSDFVRYGSGAQTWATVYGFRITIASSTTTGVVASFFVSASMPATIQFKGGSKSKTGTYEYAQLNVSDNGSYVAKSELGVVSGRVTFNTIKITVNFQEPTDPQVNEVWIFRRGGEPDPNSYYPTIGLLDEWYRVGVVTAGNFGDPWLDDVSDEDALAVGVRVNLNLISIAATSVTERIIDIVGPIFGRWYYFGEKFMYPSDINDPDLVDSSQAVRMTGSDSEVFLWARQVNESTVLVGTSCDIYALTGTFVTLPDNAVDIFYRPLGVKYPPLTNDASTYNGNVYYLANDGWRSINAGGNNPLLIAPNIDRMYRGEVCHGYAAVILNFAPGSKRFPVTIAMNKLWCNVYGVNHTQVYDFVRGYWRVVDYNLGNIVAATSTQDGKILFFYGSDLTLREIDSQSTLLVNESVQQYVDLLFPIHDGGEPKRRKDNYTLKVRCYTGATSDMRIYLTDEAETETTIGFLASATRVTDLYFNLSALIPITKTWQVKITGSVADFILEDITLDYDLRPTQLTSLHLLPNNYGTPSRKRVYEVPFEIDTLSNNVTYTPTVDGVAQAALTVNSSRKQTFAYKFPRADSDILIGTDYEYHLLAATGMFEFFGFPALPKMEIFPEPIYAFVIPVTNFGNACKKRLRVWPFVLDPCGGTLTFAPIVDGTTLSALAATYNFSGKRTVRFHYTSDVFGVDYSGIFYSSTPFEMWGVLNPDIVQTLPIARRYDQLGPEELFRYGRIKQFEYRVMPIGGTSIPYVIYFNDNSTYTGTLTVTNNVEASYFIGTPKGTSGNIVRVVFGPTAFDFHRFYIRLQVFKTGRDTELEWVTLAVPTDGSARG